MTTVLAEGFGPLRLNAHVGVMAGCGWCAATPQPAYAMFGVDTAAIVGAIT
ncbi:hypothetical protein JK182_14260, partial [Acetobacter okinawensis]|nr:hypothetical protein [Acetobacter okinawensis]